MHDNLPRATDELLLLGAKQFRSCDGPSDVGIGWLTESGCPKADAPYWCKANWGVGDGDAYDFCHGTGGWHGRIFGGHKVRSEMEDVNAVWANAKNAVQFKVG